MVKDDYAVPPPAVIYINLDINDYLFWENLQLKTHCHSLYHVEYLLMISLSCP